MRYIWIIMLVIADCFWIGVTVMDIYDCIERAMDAQENFAHPSFEALCEADARARAFVRGFLDSKEVQ